ncbi:hypothetical protein MKX01_007861 [Papaver californicum]|nr:hypothetical protein MKX01_007861 [Papaver californicum]
MSQLKQLHLTGELPDEFANLPYLQEIDLNVNYLSGSIPKAWKTLQLVNLAMLANNIGGSIPKEIAEIVTLQHLVLTDNQLEGPLPPELSKLTRLTQLALSGNNFTGVLPATFANLKNMRDFRIAGTSISGKIPDFFGNWTQLIELDIRGTSMEGPIPTTIFHLKNLTTLRVSDLKGPNTPFPDFQDMDKMSQLELRNCLIEGSIPSNIGEMMPRLMRLDLSFNRLTGDIHSLNEIPNLSYLYLTNNLLTGQIPLWITNTKQNFDLSYNNFTGPSQSGCQDSHLNKISSYASEEDQSTAWCLKKDLPCGTESKYYSFFVNCGGSEMFIGDEKYEADVSPMGPSSFYSYNDKWACSTTGDFVVPLLKGKPNYLTQASPNMTVTDLYTTARISPLSLKYYGICLHPGNYKVKLHFAEILFPIDKTTASIGTRIFDVSIQGKRYLKDFNIEEEAKGVGKSIIKEYSVDVTGSTLEIHLYWAGKGTNFIPSDFAYGPLISAIAVTPNFDPNTGHISVGVLAGIVAASCVLILLILAILWKKGCIGNKDHEDTDMKLPSHVISNKYFYFLTLLSFIVLNCLGEFRCEGQVIPEDEVEALKQISIKLNVAHWKNVNQKSCRSGELNFSGDKFGSSEGNSKVVCDCSYNSSTICHITYIQLKRLQLTGELPDEFANFPYLQELDLNVNYLSGSIPKAWKTLSLVNLSLLANNINGLIPKEIAEIASLEFLVLTDNQLEGPLPPELGKLTKLKTLAISGNNFTGALPATFVNLKNMVDFRIAGTSISGKIPDFIGNWTKLLRLDMRGTSMEGPIPSTIFHMKNLTILRVSDLKGPNMPFPDFKDMNNLRQLELRNCLIDGSIPSNIGEMLSGLMKIDLSFNRLTGDIQNLKEIPFLSNLYLTNNLLTGQIPLWMTNAKRNFDLSYNSFTGTSQSGCQDSNLNKISSYSSEEDQGIAWCLKKDLPCFTKSKYHSFFINCGGSEMVIGDEKYEADLSPMGPSSFFTYNDKWACSTTGDYVGASTPKANYLAQASPNMTVRDLYTTARISPLSLKYYGICLRPGNYNVKLHFAEIMFPIDKRAGGIGTRIFDVSIQGKRYLKDFNIEEEAKGVGNSIIKEYDVDVSGSTLEIHLYWAGKGTSFIPSDITYGPLISSIAVTPNFDPDMSHISLGVIAGIVAASFVLIVLILASLWKKGYLGKRDLEDKELRELLQTSYFTLREVKAATRNFDGANKIGEGGFGPVYKGLRPDGSLIAVKQLSAMSKQGNREFVNEIGIISALQHPNLVKLFGCCVEGNQLLVIYEYMENNCLARALYGRADQQLNLDWPTRFRICMDIAKGLAFLHEESRLKIVHRDIKATNVLLGKDFTAKISDFGMAKLDEEENTHISTRVVGTLGYLAPEYASSGRLTYKADIYSFGIVALEIVSGKSNTSYMTNDECLCLLDWANVLKEQGNLLDLIDPILETNYSKKEVLKMLNIALLCTNRSPTLRPMMSTVMGMLQGRLPVQESSVVCSPRTDDTRSSASEGISYNSQTHMSTSSQGGTLLEMSNSSVGDPWQADSTFSTY